MAVILVWLAVVGCNSSEDDFIADDPSTRFTRDANDKIDDGDVEKVKVGMSLSEIEEAIGKPHRDTGSGVIIAEWDLESGKVLSVSFNPDDGDTENTSLAFDASVKEK